MEGSRVGDKPERTSWRGGERVPERLTRFNGRSEYHSGDPVHIIRARVTVSPHASADVSAVDLLDEAFIMQRSESDAGCCPNPDGTYNHHKSTSELRHNPPQFTSLVRERPSPSAQQPRCPMMRLSMRISFLHGSGSEVESFATHDLTNKHHKSISELRRSN
jgi:hypothetical protein